MAIEISSSDILSSIQLKHHIKINAGPGAGKTHFLVENIKNIIRKEPKITESKNRKVLCITYTNAAVNEIKRRLDDFGEKVEVFTIHGFIIKHIIKPYQTELKKHMLNDFGIEIKSNRMITSQIEGLGILHGHDKQAIYDFINNESKTYDELTYSKKIMGDVQVDINKFGDEDSIDLKKSSRIDEQHIKAIKKYGWSVARKLTHDEILYFGYKMVEANSTIAYALRVQFPYIFLDEFQDTNPLQARLIQYLGAKSTIVCTIGDVAQSIYSFQGARPSKFIEFNINQETDTSIYKISGNRRSTTNIICLCNYLRRKDNLRQEGLKEYDNQDIRKQIENKKVSFIVGDSQSNIDKINAIVNEDGAILTRTWASAFKYIQGISDEQKDLLKKIYNSYYASPIDIRSDIAEHNNVTWVRAFKFIFTLWDGFKIKSVADIINAFRLFIDSKTMKSTGFFGPNVIFNLNELLKELFQHHNQAVPTIHYIEKLNSLLSGKYKAISNLLSNKNGDGRPFEIPYFDEHDREALVENVCKLEWKVSYLLFKSVFADESKYMTVHQAKGLEWDKVVVSVQPTRNDKTSVLDMFCDPKITSETPSDEFTRLFYVACSRAKEELYIHLDNTPEEVEIIKKVLLEYAGKHGINDFFEFV